MIAPLCAAVEARTFLGGGTPTYVDYVALGAFQWARVMSPFQLRRADDAVAAWLDRCLDLYGGLARRGPPSTKEPQ